MSHIKLMLSSSTIGLIISSQCFCRTLLLAKRLAPAYQHKNMKRSKLLCDEKLHEGEHHFTILMDDGNEMKSDIRS